MSVDGMLAQMSAGELTEWMAYLSIEHPDQRLEWGVAQVSATMANLWGDTKKKGRQWQAADFLPDLRSEEERRADQVQRMMDEARMRAMRMGQL